MKKVALIFVFIFAVTGGWCANKKITVGQLEDMLRSMQQDKKSDSDVATALKRVELSQELTRSAMNGLVSYVPGPLATEQIYVLEARSADLIPPESDLPSTPAPDSAAQKAILEKAGGYVGGTYTQLDSLTATKTTLRFQDNVEALASSSGLQGGATDVVVSSGFSNPAAFVHYINSSETQVASARGAEKWPSEKDKTPWGANKMIALQAPDPNLADIFNEARNSGNLHWLRWESINGKPAAVYAFTVPRKQSHLDVNVCCFPNVNQAGIATFYTATTASALGGGSGGGGVAGNFQTSTEWHNFKSTAGYHGELFIDPDSGIVLRMITEAELKPSDVVHELDIRVDFGPFKVNNKTIVVPMKTFVNTLVVPNGDSGAATYSTRRTLFTSEYKDYAEPGTK
jgi:hypothetical protein